MGDIQEQIYIHILNQTLIDNTIMISDAHLSETYQLPQSDVAKFIDELIARGYIMRIRDGFYSVRFGHLDALIDDYFYDNNKN